jgi:hypothetical protein
MREKMKKFFIDRDTWARGFFMLLFSLLLFALAYSPVRIIIGATVLFQFGAVLFVGTPNQRLLDFGYSLAVYAFQIITYLTYNSEKKPFPFSDWPDHSTQL